MEELLNLPWRHYPASVVMLGGAALAAYGFRLAVNALRRPPLGPARSLTLLRGFRFAVIGIALVHAGAAWNWQVLWPLVFALVFVGEEMLEISFQIATVRHDLRRQSSDQRAPRLRQ
ncbi:MAG TPA: hypothetical protein VHL09_06200 [Dehalococcoidia bacterium]|nr:hypothetical protein [Dehalococcoidia bacterium]